MRDACHGSETHFACVHFRTFFQLSHFISFHVSCITNIFRSRFFFFKRIFCSFILISAVIHIGLASRIQTNCVSAFVIHKWLKIKHRYFRCYSIDVLIKLLPNGNDGMPILGHGTMGHGLWAIFPKNRSEIRNWMEIQRVEVTRNILPKIFEYFRKIAVTTPGMLPREKNRINELFRI